MKDSLRNFITKHRDEFDDKQPADRVWSRIEYQLPGKKISLWSNLHVWRAAAVLFLSLSVYLMISRTGNQQLSADKAKLQVEFSDLEKFYNEQISDKIELISNIQEYNDEDTFTQDIKKLDAMYQVLREQMKAQPSEKIKDALILNMLVRIDLLNQQIKILEESENKPDEVTI